MLQTAGRHHRFLIPGKTVENTLEFLQFAGQLLEIETPPTELDGDVQGVQPCSGRPAIRLPLGPDERLGELAVGVETVVFAVAVELGLKRSNLPGDELVVSVDQLSCRRGSGVE